MKYPNPIARWANCAYVRRTVWHLLVTPQNAVGRRERTVPSTVVWTIASACRSSDQQLIQLAYEWVGEDGQEAQWTPHAEEGMSEIARVYVAGRRSLLQQEEGRQRSGRPVLLDVIALSMSLFSVRLLPGRFGLVLRGE